MTFNKSRISFFTTGIVFVTIVCFGVLTGILCILIVCFDVLTDIVCVLIKGQGSHASVAECTLAPLFVRLFAGSTDRESVIACMVCRDGPVFTLVGVLCAGSFQNGDTLDFDFYMASCCELWASAIVPGR